MIITTQADPVPLARTTLEDYGRAVSRMRHNEFWWYLHGLVVKKNWWKPFRDADHRWWWYVKPGFVWPVDYFSPLTVKETVRPRKLLLGWQYPVPQAQANSFVHLNVIPDLSGYDLARISRKKRRYGIRRAFQHLDFAVAQPADEHVGNEACIVWNSHVARTGWNKRLTPSAFRLSWKELAACPGTTVLTARDPARENVLCAWLIVRVIDETVYVDTLTSHSDRVEWGPNDGLIFLCLLSAARMGIRQAHYALKSRFTSLEAFKRSLGFVPHPFPSRLVLRPPVGLMLRTCKPKLYKRLLGDESWSEREPGRPTHGVEDSPND